MIDTSIRIDVTIGHITWDEKNSCFLKSLSENQSDRYAILVQVQPSKFVGGSILGSAITSCQRPDDSTAATRLSIREVLAK